MNVTIYTDASIKQRRGAWATVIIRDGCQPVEFSGSLRGRFRSSTATEICAVANALHKAHQAGLVEHGDAVMVHCDNEGAVGRINTGGTNTWKTDRLLIEARHAIAKLAKRHGFTVKSRHVKGHQAMATVCEHGVYNLRCDELCAAIRDRIEPTSFDVLLARIARERARAAKRRAA